MASSIGRISSFSIFQSHKQSVNILRNSKNGLQVVVSNVDMLIIPSTRPDIIQADGQVLQEADHNAYLDFPVGGDTANVLRKGDVIQRLPETNYPKTFIDVIYHVPNTEFMRLGLVDTLR